MKDWSLISQKIGLGDSWRGAPMLGTGLLLLSLPNLAAVVTEGYSYSALARFFYGLGLLLLPAAVWQLDGRKLLKWLFPLAFVAPMSAGYHLYARFPVREEAILVSLEANEAELSAISWLLLWGSLATVAGILLMTLIVRSTPASSGRLNGWLRGGTIALVLGLPMKDIALSNLTKGWTTEEYRLRSVFPTNIAFALFNATRVRLKMNNRGDVYAKVMTKTVKSPEKMVMVIVVGESARWASFQVNGYERQTTPNLAAMPDLLNFKDVAAPGPCTMLSVPSILSTADPSQVKEASGFPSVIQVFRKAGFWTAWISTQKKHGSMATICSQFADDADESLFLNGRLDLVGPEAKLDGQLVTEIDRLLASGHDRMLIVLHTIGNHSPYHLRYPKKYEHWPVDNTQCTRFGVRVSDLEVTNLVNSYDNTVLYTDWVLSQVVERLKRLPTASAMYFISDHGENMNHPVASPFFHGQWTRDVMHIPMFVWLSPSYRVAMPEKVEQLTLRQSSPFSGDATFHTLVDMGGLDCDGLVRTKSLASPAWAPSRRLMIGWEGNIGDYDTDLMDGPTAMPMRR